METELNFEILEKVCANTPDGHRYIILQASCAETRETVWAIGDDQVCAVAREDFLRRKIPYNSVLIQEFPYRDNTPESAGKWRPLIETLTDFMLSKYLEHDGLAHVYPQWLPESLRPSNMPPELFKEACETCDHIILHDSVPPMMDFVPRTGRAAAPEKSHEDGRSLFQGNKSEGNGQVAQEEPVTGGPQMDRDKFWQIIDGAREKAGRWQDMRGPLLEELSKLEPTEILLWQRILDEYQALSHKDKLCAAAAVMMNGCSDDSFDYFREWLIAQGRDVFLKALADPDSLAGLETVRALGREVLSLEYEPPDGYENEPRFEGLLYVPAYAYESKPGAGDFYGALDGRRLSDQEKAAIAGEIVYAADIDAKWFDWDASWDERDARLRELCPGLFAVFQDGEFSDARDGLQTPPATPVTTRADVMPEKPAARKSVIKKLREGRNAATPREPREKKPSKGGPER